MNQATNTKEPEFQRVMDDSERASSQLRDVKARLAKLRLALSLATAVLGAVIAITSAFLLFSDRTLKKDPVPNLLQEKYTKAFQRSIESLEMKISTVEQKAFAVARPPGDSEAVLALVDLKASVQQMQSRMERIESAILADPLRAVELPLVKKEIEHVRASQEAAQTAMKDSIDRVYNVTTWLLGLIGASILGLAVTNMFTPRRQRSDREIPPT